MTNRWNILKKTVAIALATMFLSLPFADVAAAAPKHEGRPPRQEQRVEPKHDRVHHREHARHDKKDRHHVEHKAPRHKDKVVVHRPAPPPKHHKKDNSGKVVGGIILGAILGAVIANNN